MNNELHICFVTDKQWLRFTQRAIYDIIIRKNKDTKITFYILVDRVNDCKMFDIFNTVENISAITVEVDSKKEFPNARRYPQSWHNTFGYLKLAIPSLDVFKNVDRVIYLDVDVLARKDLTDIFNLDLHGKGIGCTKNWWHIRQVNYLDFSIRGDMDSGIMVMDLPRLRSIHFTEICRINAVYISRDQCIIDSCMSKECNYIDPKYMIPYHLIVDGSPAYKDISRWNNFFNTNYKSIDELIDESYFWHFAGYKEEDYIHMPSEKICFDTSEKRLQEFLKTNKVMPWKKEDDDILYIRN